jgi:hypothetical protein
MTAAKDKEGPTSGSDQRGDIRVEGLYFVPFAFSIFR